VVYNNKKADVTRDLELAEELDILIKGGRVLDGTGNPWFEADVGIRSGKVVAMGRSLRHDASEVVEAKGLYVAPGFVDIHTHSDLTLLLNGRAESKLRQGVTSALVGLCGLSAAPISVKHLEDWKGVLAGIVAHYSIASSHVDWSWSSIGDYLRRLEDSGISQNIGTFVGHAAVRVAVMGLAEGKPSPAELSDMQALVEASMYDGAFGLTTGLDFAPGNAATKEELIELCRPVARYGGIYCSHQRSGSTDVIGATKESIEIARTSGTRLIISHLVPKLGGWGTGPELLRLVEDARKSGIDVVFDDYFITGAPPSPLTLLPAWAFEGGKEAMLNRLQDRQARERIRREYVGPLATVVKQGRWDLVTVTNAGKNRDLVGKSIQEIAQQKGVDPWDAMFDILAREEGSAEFVTYFRSGDDANLMIAHPYAIIESDTCSTAPYGVLRDIRDFKAYNLIVSVLRQYVREKRTLSLEEGIRKLTSLPAAAIGLRGRGILREGMWADVVIFNASTLREGGSYRDPQHYPTGIDHVIVNGQVVIDQGIHRGLTPGKVLKGTESIHSMTP